MDEGGGWASLSQEHDAARAAADIGTRIAACKIIGNRGEPETGAVMNAGGTGDRKNET